MHRTPLAPRARWAVPAAAALSLLALVAATTGQPAGAADAPVVNDKSYNLQHFLPQVGAAAGWGKGAGAGQVIAVVDTGVDLNHEDFKCKVNGKPKLLPGKSFVGTPTPQDDDGHGTHVAGIAAACTNNTTGVAGVAPLAQIMPIKVFPKGQGANGQDISDGIKYAADNGATVINLSLGAGGDLRVLGSADYSSAINYAYGKGVVVTLSAGNDGDDAGPFGQAYTTVSAMIVASVNRFDQRASYSEPVGTPKWPISAPGGDGPSAGNLIYSTNFVDGAGSSYGYKAGTSMAAPVVSGAAAVVRSNGLDGPATVQKLLNTAKRNMEGYDPKFYGRGRVDVAAAIADLKGPAGIPLGAGSGSTQPTTLDTIGKGKTTVPSASTDDGSDDGSGGTVPGGSNLPKSGKTSKTTVAAAGKVGALPPGAKRKGGASEDLTLQNAASDEKPWVPISISLVLLGSTSLAAVNVQRGKARAKRRARTLA